MVYWLLSLPLISGRRDRTWEILQEKTSGSLVSTNHKLEIPELRVGTLDTLLTLSDDLVKVNNMMDALVSKIRRQVGDVGGSTAIASLKVEGMPVDSYLTKFHWDEAKFPTRRPLKETVEKVTEIATRIEDDLKVKVSDYNNLKSQQSAVSRKMQGSLAVRDIALLVRPQDFIDSENLTTLFVVVSKYGHKEWEQSYEKLSNYVVPRSSKVVSEDNDYMLVTVVLFKRVVDDFKSAARVRGFQVREFNPAGENSEQTAAQVDSLKRELEAKKSALESWCKTAFGEAFSSWLHICVIRLFAESILRYGLPPAFQAVVAKPTEKQESKLRQVLAATFGDGKSNYWKDDGSTPPSFAGEGELHPYVSYTINLDTV